MSQPAGRPLCKASHFFCSQDGKRSWDSMDEASKVRSASSKTKPRSESSFSRLLQCDIRKSTTVLCSRKRCRPMAKDRRTQARHRLTDCMPQVPAGIQGAKKRLRQDEMNIIGCQKESSRVHRLWQDAAGCKIHVFMHLEIGCDLCRTRTTTYQKLLTCQIRVY